MKIDSKSEDEKLHLKEEIDYNCSQLNTTVQFPDFEVSMTKQTFTNSDRHLKKHKRNIELKVRPKELIREQIRLEIEFLKNKIKLFSIQTENQLKNKLEYMHNWMNEVQEKLSNDEIKENNILNKELEKSNLGETFVDLNVLDDSSALINFSKINESAIKKTNKFKS